MATSGGWDNDEEDDEQGYSAEEMDIDQAPGGSAAASGVPQWPLMAEQCTLLHALGACPGGSSSTTAHHAGGVLMFACTTRDRVSVYVCCDQVPKVVTARMMPSPIGRRTKRILK